MESDRRIHIVAFDVPWPPDYGGVIDIYFKIVSLARHGVKITLHIFEYGRIPAPELQQYCDRIFYYPRRKWVNPLTIMPYITASRSNPRLLANLLKDNAPILFEGIHTCFLLNHRELRSRIRIVRMHNIEHHYYRQTAMLEKNPILKLWYLAESVRLKLFERKLDRATAILAISSSDYAELSSRFSSTYHIGPFHSGSRVTSVSGMGNFALYHGKLSVAENNKAALFLAGEVFTNMHFRLVIAGSNPSKSLIREAEQNPSLTLIANPSPEQVENLIKEAHINLLPSFQKSGIKLKLINVLYQGRFVIANRLMIEGTGCETLCEVAETAEEFRYKTELLSHRLFSQAEADIRELTLGKLFDNDKMALEIIKIAGI